MPRRRRHSSKQLTTTIEPVVEDGESSLVGDNARNDAEKLSEVISEPEPEWKSDARGLIYFDDYDGLVDTDAEPIVPPECSINQEVPSVYQCIKCGRKSNATPTGDTLFRFKCSRCFGKAFNKIRPTKWVKFHAS